MSGKALALTLSFAALVLGAGAADVGLVMAVPQQSDSLSCGRVLSLTCASRNSDAQLLLERPGGTFLDVRISVPLREDVRVRLSEPYRQRIACVANSAAPNLTRDPILIRNSEQLSIKDDLAPVRGVEVFSTCDPSVEPPTPVRQPGPQYTSEAMRAHVNGMVTLYGIVDANGHVGDIRVIRSLQEGLDANAQQAFGQWQFRPATRMGEPVAVAVTAAFAFHVAPQ
jgi:TonB family protein